MILEGQYLNYNEYKSLGGSIDKMPFNLLEFEARKSIDKYTLGRLKNLPTQIDEVKVCEYQLINLLNDYNSIHRTVASESIDGYSVSYNASLEQDKKTKEVESIIKTYLSECKLEDGTPYLYRGVEC